MYENISLQHCMPNTYYEVLRALKIYFPDYAIGSDGFTINPDSSVDYEGSINLSVMNKNLELINGKYAIPIKFNRVSGDFKIKCDNLKTLVGCPEVVGNDFVVLSKNLSSLKGGPKIIGDTYLVNLPKLTSIEGICKSAHDVIICSESMTSLTGIHKHLRHVVRKLELPSTINSNLLGLLYMLKFPEFIRPSAGPGYDDRTATAIRMIWDHAQSKNIDILACQEDLISAGLKEHARL